MYYIALKLGAAEVLGKSVNSTTADHSHKQTKPVNILVTTIAPTKHQKLLNLVMRYFCSAVTSTSARVRISLARTGKIGVRP